MSDSEKSLLMSGVDESHWDTQSEDFEVVMSSNEDPSRAYDFRPYADDEENSDRCRRVPQGFGQFRIKLRRIHESLFTIRSFTCIILFASIVALALLVASRIILDKRPYSWGGERIGMVSEVITSSAIIILAAFACAAINLLLITNHLLSTIFNIVVDIVLSIYLIQAAQCLSADEQQRWSYQARDWCANPHEGGCARLVNVLGYLNNTTGYIAVGIAFIHVALLMTRIIFTLRSSFWPKPISSSRDLLEREEFQYSSGV